MSVETKKRLILRNLLHVNSHMDTRQKGSNGVYVQITADLWPTTPRPRTRGTGAALPFQRTVQRAIGHIVTSPRLSQTAVPKTTDNRTPRITDRGSTACTVPVPDIDDSLPNFSPRKVVLRYRR